MFFAQLLLTLLLLLVCSFAPGFLLVRRLRWSGMEKLCGSVALSLVLLYLASWGIYLLAQPAAYFGLAAACGLAGIVTARDAWQLFRGMRVRRALLGFGLLLAWTLVVASIIRNYSGAMWGGDWLEHFQRSLFFLHNFPKSTLAYGEYLMPARPPMMNVLAAFFMGVTADRFEIFQLVFLFLNLLVFLPCCLVVRALAPVRRVGLWPLVGVFAMNPAVMENATYTWTKSLTAFFVVFALSLYLSAWRKRDPARMTAAFLALAAGLLVHYSAGPYVVFFALHFLLFLFRGRPSKWRELATIAIVSACLLLTWFGWSMATYGVKPTFASNTTITPRSKEVADSMVAKIAGNVADSILPRISYNPERVHDFDQPYAPAVWRDNIFLLYQTNLVLSMGLLGGPLVVWSVIAAFRRRTGTGAERQFWLMLIGFSLFIGLAVVGERDYFGVAHLTLIPLEVVGITLLAARFCTRRRLAILIVAGCAIDFSLGVFFHARVQHLENTSEHTYFTGLGWARDHFEIGTVGPDSLGGSAWRNWMEKHYVALCEKWLAFGEGFHPGDPALEPAKANLRASIAERLKQDDTVWHGWYRRNGGEVELIGDHFGGSGTTSAVLALAAIGLLLQMARQARRAPVMAAASAMDGAHSLPKGAPALASRRASGETSRSSRSQHKR